MCSTYASCKLSLLHFIGLLNLYVYECVFAQGVVMIAIKIAHEMKFTKNKSMSPLIMEEKSIKKINKIKKWWIALVWRPRSVF